MKPPKCTKFDTPPRTPGSMNACINGCEVRAACMKAYGVTEETVSAAINSRRIIDGVENGGPRENFQIAQGEKKARQGNPTPQPGPAPMFRQREKPKPKQRPVPTVDDAAKSPPVHTDKKETPRRGYVIEVDFEGYDNLLTALFDRAAENFRNPGQELLATFAGRKTDERIFT